MNVRFRNWMAGVGVVGAISIAGFVDTACSIVVSTSGEQCSSDSECTSRGGLFAFSKCQNQMCVPECVSSSECPANELGPRVCAQNRCAALLTPQTVVNQVGAPTASGCFGILDGSVPLQGSMLSDTDALAKVTYDIGVDPIVIGYMADAFTRAQSSNNFIERRIPDGLQLALNELNKRSDTFPFPNRKVIVLMCGETDEPGTEPGASAAAIATHLAEVGDRKSVV